MKKSGQLKTPELKLDLERDFVAAPEPYPEPFFWDHSAAIDGSGPLECTYVDIDIDLIDPEDL